MSQSECRCGICGSSNYDIEGSATVLVRDSRRDGEIVDEYDSEEGGRCNNCGATYHRPPWYHTRVPKPPVPVGWWESPEREYSADSPMREILRTQRCTTMQQVTFRHEPKPVNVTLAGRVDHYANRTEYGLLPYLPVWATDGASWLVVTAWGEARIEMTCTAISGDYADEPYENEVDLDRDDVLSVLARAGYPLPPWA